MELEVCHEINFTPCHFLVFFFWTLLNLMMGFDTIHRIKTSRGRKLKKLNAPTEWNTTVVAEKAMCPKGKHVLV
jgi:hypothetical protein